MDLISTMQAIVLINTDGRIAEEPSTTERWQSQAKRINLPSARPLGKLENTSQWI